MVLRIIRVRGTLTGEPPTQGVRYDVYLKDPDTGATEAFSTTYEGFGPTTPDDLKDDILAAVGLTDFEEGE